jgi:hypothetical protein
MGRRRRWVWPNKFSEGKTETFNGILRESGAVYLPDDFAKMGIMKPGLPTCRDGGHFLKKGSFISRLFRFL